MKTARLVRHSVTLDGTDDVRRSKRGFAIAWLVGAFYALANVFKVIVSPAPRASETGEIYCEAAEIDASRITDERFGQMPNLLPSGESKADAIKRLKRIAEANGITIEAAIFHRESQLLGFAAQRGKDGFARLAEIMADVPDDENLLVFSHGGMIEPIAIAAQRAINGDDSDTLYSLDEIAGPVWECEAYEIVFDAENKPVEVRKIGLPSDIIELVKLAKKDRR